LKLVAIPSFGVSYMTYDPMCLIDSLKYYQDLFKLKAKPKFK